MPMVGQSIFTTPQKTYLQDAGLSYEAAMGIPPQDGAPVFHFRKRFGNIDWRKMASIDVDKVARELDFITLQENISTVAFCNIDAVGDLDPLFAKLFKLSQFTVEYLLHSQEYLQSVIQNLEAKIEAQYEESEKIVKSSDEMKGEMTKLRQENKRRRKMIEQQQMLIESGASSYYKCPHCEKAFMNASFLQGHMQRRHPGSVHYIGDVIAHSQREQSKLAGQLQNLDSDLQRERDNFNSKLKKAAEEKAAWTARSRREMDKWKTNEESRWRREIDDMKKSFLEEISQLNSRDDRNKQTITSLQSKIDDRQSNLGELMDGVESDRERTKTYETKINNLEHDNYIKQQKLDALELKVQQMNEDNTETKDSLKRDYASQFKRLNQKVDKNNIPKAQQVDVATPTATDFTDGRMSSFRRRKADIKEDLKRPLLNMLDQRLQQCGIDHNASGISTNILTNKLMVLKKERQNKAKQFEGFFQIRSNLRSKIEEESRKKGGASFPRKRQQSAQPRRNILPKTSTPGEALRVNSSTTHYATTGRSTMEKSSVIKPPEHDNDSPWDSEISEIEKNQESAPKQYVKTPHPVKGIPKPGLPKLDDNKFDESDVDDILMSDDDSAKPSTSRHPDVTSGQVKHLAQYIASKKRSLKKPPAGAVEVMMMDTQVKKFEEEEEEDSFALSSLEETSPKPFPRHGQVMSSNNTYDTSKFGSGQLDGVKSALGTSKDLNIEDVSDWDDDDL